MLEPGDTLQRQPAEGRVPFQVLLQFPLLWGGKRFPKCGAHRKLFPLGPGFPDADDFPAFEDNARVAHRAPNLTLGGGVL